MGNKLNGKERREQLLRTAVGLAAKGDYTALTRAEIAQAAGCSTALVTHYFETVTQLRRAIIRRAVKDRVLPVIAQGLAKRDPHAKKAPDDLKQAAVKSLAG